MNLIIPRQIQKNGLDRSKIEPGRWRKRKNKRRFNYQIPFFKRITCFK